ncbi:MAG: hypothetical protein KF863_03155 [Rubrivivax sp.]|nr:hypothetical protein [Rubrivivax sp.]
MDLSDLPQAPLPAPAGVSALRGPHALVAQLGSEVAGLLSGALDRVVALAASGRIDRAGLAALRAEIEAARRAGIAAQQLARLAGGDVALARERVDLAALLHEALRQRAREVELRGLELRQVVAAAQVLGDATLLFSLLQTLLDWSFEHTVSRIDLTLALREWPQQARLSCSFAHRAPDEVASTQALPDACPQASLDTMSWRLLEQTAVVLGLPLARHDTDGRCELRLDFPDTLAPRLDLLDDAAAPAGAPGPQDLAGHHVAVLATRRETRNLVRQALRPLGLRLDFVDTVEALGELCAETLPQAVVHEAALAGDRFERLRAALQAAQPAPGFVRIAEDGRGFAVVQVGGRPCASVARDDLLEALPEALRFELARRAAAPLPAAA